MAYTAYKDSTTTIVDTFREVNDDFIYVLNDPDSSVTFAIYEYPLASTPVAVVGPLTPTTVSEAVYSYEWTPTETGTFLARFVGTYSDLTTKILDQDWTVVETSAVTTTAGLSLASDYTIQFASGLEPLYVDPETLSEIFDEASLIDIAEQIYIYSTEVKNWFSLSDTETPTDLQLEYIRAAAACALSRIYGDPSLGDGGSITLGDFIVENAGTGGGVTNRASASTWCELAAVLRDEIKRKSAIPKATRKADCYTNPISPRSF